jgi:hypothetical protein
MKASGEAYSKIFFIKEAAEYLTLEITSAYASFQKG